MKRFILQFATIILIVAVASGVVFAGGYQLNEHGARATALGGAFVARAADASAVYFNPAGLAFQKGNNFLVGASFILPSTTVLNKTGVPTETKMESQIFYPPNIYGTYEISDGLVAGIGVFTPFGLGSKYASTWVGRYSSVETELQTFYISPSIAYKVSDKLSFGAGFSYVYGSVSLLTRAQAFGTLTAHPLNPALFIPSSPMDGTMELSATGTGFTYNVGLLYKPFEGFSFGASFRSELMLEFSGDATFSGMGAFAPYFPGGTGKATLPMPMNLQVGASYDVAKDLNVEVDFQYVGWSAYKTLTIDLPKSPTSVTIATGATTTKTVAQAPIVSEKKWDDGLLFRAGIEYQYNEKLTLRAGGLLDYSPQPTSKMEPMLPDANRVDLSFGAGYKLNENMTIDLVYMAVLFEERSTTYTAFPASYNSMAHIIGFNFGYSF